MPEWMIKGKARERYLDACKNADINHIHDNPVLMNMFNNPEQYEAVLNRLVDLFGPLDGMHIIEIGGGYGGQAKAICDRFKVRTYTIIDLPEVCELQRRFLHGYNIRITSGIEWHCYTLVISNYALSEIPNNSVYMRNIVDNSQHGYITCNTDFVNIPYANRMPDIPGERETNYVLWW